MSRKFALPALCACLVLALSAVSRAVSVTASLQSSDISSLGVIKTPTYTDLLLTGHNGTAGDFASVYVFQLPTEPAGQSVSSAAFGAYFDEWGTPQYNIDLYGLGARSAATVAASDFFVGPYATDSTDATALDDNFLTPAASSETVSFSGSSLADYLNAQYASQGAGSYVFLRLSPDYSTAPAGGNFRFYTDALPGHDPTLTLSFVPEPSSAAVLLLAGLAALRVRRARAAKV